MTIETRPFGRIEAPDETVIEFPGGLYGLEGSRRYCLLPHGDSPGFFWLLSMDTPAIAMVVTDPFPFFPEYEVAISDSDARILEATAASEVTIYTSVSVTRGDASAAAGTRAPSLAGGPDSQVTTNLLGPLAINHAARRGLQLILDGARYTTRHPIGQTRETC
jgi:flagellar assembly factor FliW